MAAEPLTLDTLLARLSRDGVARTVTALRKPPVSSLLLQELTELEGNPLAREFVAAYPLSPGHLLELLSTYERTPAILARLAANPRTPPHVLAELASSADAGVRAGAATHPKLPPRELFTLARDSEDSVRAALASSASLRLPDQAQLSDDDAPSVRLALAGHSALSPQVALVLGSDTSAVVRTQAVATAAAEEETVLGWAASEEEDVQLALTRRAELPRRAWRLLLLSPHASVRIIAREKTPPDEAELYFLATRGTAPERAWVAARSPLSRALQCLLARDTEAQVRVSLATNASLDDDVARYFTSLAEEDCCVALASNPAVSDVLIQELAATRLPSVLRCLAYREGLEPALVRALVSLSPEFRRHYSLGTGSVDGLDAETARALLADPLPRVRALGVAGHAWRRADLYELARDPLPVVRLAALHHVNAPEGLLEDLSRDADAGVAAAASERLAALRRERQSLQRFAADLSTKAAAVSTPRIPVATTPEPAAPPPPSEQPQDSDYADPFPSPSESDPGLLGKLKRIFSW